MSLFLTSFAADSSALHPVYPFLPPGLGADDLEVLMGDQDDEMQYDLAHELVFVSRKL